VYPVIQLLVGEDFFAVAADAYAAANPSRSGNIQDYGGAFSKFLEGYTPAASLPYLSDVASLEWRRLQTSIAEQHASLDVQALAQIPQDELPELRFHHQPGAQAFASPYPILSIWEFSQQAEPEGELGLDIGGECVLFYRADLDVRMRRISAGEHAFLVSLYRGSSFAKACEAAMTEELSFDVQACFAAIVRDEMLTDFYL
jgi:hypothetical protein